ncbi:outer membrane protein [Ferranicluibacter rubi]|uniref:Porin family protein n=1 Tax=Ferranicluibacter rubi TaxID=2715133 RepID=A0AA43ZHB2_9HYPH|nr:outer membrane protein [Ferranicluibacter rubi]PYE31696.1 outer membrane immunogenic protein [Rhizobium sp. PP-WC-1G-195]TCP78009.1 outer membrane immunogenic protein [Rhizobium sp. PP-CC-2G-626]TCQ04331.1 outer membrane immunogenic protein [Rhizobium sp. PP-F2F-G36]TCQ25798.1 outer membrane immunogenic protein [Rhizobium sp. PP-CC-3G-465]NHT76928.1 porin family protein [Ferranicluibacter rubi]
MNIRILALTILSSATALPALSADMNVLEDAPQPVQQVSSTYDWSGFYLGGQGGYAWMTGDVRGIERELDGGAAGAHAGYNLQSGSIVYGIENDVNYNFDSKGSAKTEWDASGRARVGYALDRTLIFATAGVAAAGAVVERPAAGKKDEILIGWTAGGGIEHAVTDNILVRGEYRYTDFGEKDFGDSVGKFGATQNKVILGASFKF